MDLDRTFQSHRDHYKTLARRYGSSPRGVQYPDTPSQWARYRILAEIGVSQNSSVGDFGCGTGEFLNFLTEELDFKGSYRGVDIVDEHLNSAAERFPDATFENRDIFESGFGEEVDFLFVAGVFNNKFPGTEPDEYMKEILLRLFKFARKGLAFNSLSTYVDFKDDSLFYTDPGEVFRFCKENLSNLVTLRHDYQLKPGVLAYEYTVYVFPSNLSMTRKNET